MAADAFGFAAKASLKNAVTARYLLKGYCLLSAAASFAKSP